MPKAKPISLHPLTFDEAIKRLMDIDPAKLRIPSKPHKRKRRLRKQKKSHSQ
jgi:hypothetical protein